MFADIGREYRGASLGDRRRSARLEAIGERLAQDPSRSFPEAMASEGQLEALYRFLNNDGVSFARILEPHAGMTAERCADLSPPATEGPRIAGNTGSQGPSRR